MELGQPLKRHTVIPVRHNMPASEPPTSPNTPAITPNPSPTKTPAKVD